MQHCIAMRPESKEIGEKQFSVFSTPENHNVSSDQTHLKELAD